MGTPADERSNDIVHRNTVLVTHHAELAVRNLTENKANFVSSGLVANPTGELGFSKALLVRVPDGPAIEMEEK